jgi:hypothetical protein
MRVSVDLLTTNLLPMLVAANLTRMTMTQNYWPIMSSDLVLKAGNSANNHESQHRIIEQVL